MDEQARPYAYLEAIRLLGGCGFLLKVIKSTINIIFRLRVVAAGGHVAPYLYPPGGQVRRGAGTGGADRAGKYPNYFGNRCPFFPTGVGIN